MNMTQRLRNELHDRIDLDRYQCLDDVENFREMAVLDAFIASSGSDLITDAVASTIAELSPEDAKMCLSLLLKCEGFKNKLYKTEVNYWFDKAVDKHNYLRLVG